MNWVFIVSVPSAIHMYSAAVSPQSVISTVSMVICLILKNSIYRCHRLVNIHEKLEFYVTAIIMRFSEHWTCAKTFTYSIHTSVYFCVHLWSCGYGCGGVYANETNHTAKSMWRIQFVWNHRGASVVSVFLLAKRSVVFRFWFYSDAVNVSDYVHTL